jgi:TIR domain
MPAPRFQHGFANDVFISYTREDDREEAGIRWVARFEAELKARLAKVSGQSIQTWRDDRLSGADRFAPEIEEQLLGSAVLLPVVTPSYFRSEWCNAERAKFIEGAKSSRGLDVGNKSRVVKAAKTRVPLDQYPEELRELLEFRFYVEEPNNTAREFHLSSDEHVQRRFYTIVDDAAQAIEKILRGLETGSAPKTKGFVYLGETSSDIDAERDQLRRSLTQCGYAVLPQAPLRLRSGPEVEHIAKSDLAQCNLAVYPVGAYYGPVPERSGDRSITELQLETALGDGRNGTLSRMIWVPPGITIAEDRQQQLLVRIRTEFPSKGFEIIESPLTEIETHIKDRLERPAPAVEHVDDGAEDTAEIYLLCLAADRDAARAVRDCLFNEGFEIKLQPSTDEGAGTLHTRRLESADAFLIYWGSADEGWVERVLTELKKAKGLRKGKPILSQAIFVADPPTDVKRDFLTHQATLLPGFSPTSVKEALQPMIAELRRPRPGAKP